MKIRYYADAEMSDWHDQILGLLETIRERHGIPVEIDRVEQRFGPITDFPGDIRRVSAQEVYDRDFEDNQEYISNVDWPDPDPHKHGDNYEIAGHVAVAGGEDRVVWVSRLPGHAAGHDPGTEELTPIDFLEDVADSPNNRVCIECLHFLDGDENFCPNCGYELPSRGYGSSSLSDLEPN